MVVESAPHPKFKLPSESEEFFSKTLLDEFEKKFVTLFEDLSLAKIACLIKK
jgi:hypothetical protein